jgi:hypothetical protein
LGEADELVTLNAGRCALSFLTQSFRLLAKTLIERKLPFEIAALRHSATPFRQRKAGAQPAVSSPINAKGGAVMDWRWGGGQGM